MNKTTSTAGDIKLQAANKNFSFDFDHNSMISASMKCFIEAFHAGKGRHFLKRVPKYFFLLENVE